MDRARGQDLVQRACDEARSGPADTRRTFAFDFGDVESPPSVSDRCYRKFGFRPISFSIPGSALPPPRDDPARTLSDVIPGRPYSFDSESLYYREYADSMFAISHKKAGWDCFRHVEILAQGAVPLMPDIGSVPEFTMTHYPKAFLRRVWREYVGRGAVPDRDTRNALTEFTRTWLTSTSMAHVLTRALPGEHARILFLDESLPTLPNYLSILTLIGLTGTPGFSVDTVWSPGYAYSDWDGDAAALYGRGFGYSRRMDPATRSIVGMNDSAGKRSLPDLDEYDAVVIGEVTRNRRLAELIARASTSAVRIYLHGEDRAPDRADRKWLRGLGGEVFVREIY